MDVRLDSDLLRTFVAIADSGSFTRAADVVHRTQSAVSMQVKRLEEIAGHELFRRGPRGVTLTPTGETLLGNARRIVRLLDETGRSLNRAPLEGEVRVGVPEEYGSTLLPGVLARFAESHPRVRVTVRCDPSLALERALARGDLDMAIVGVERGGKPGEVLIHDPSLWVTSARHFVHELDPLPLAMFESDCWWREWALATLDGRGRRYRVAYTSASVAGIQAAVASGLAVAILSQSTLPPEVRELAADEGFDPVPGLDVVLRQNPASTSGASEAMARAIRGEFASSVGRPGTKVAAN